MTKTKLYERARVSWMIRRDMPGVLEIEKESFEFPWAEEDFIRVLRKRDCIGMVVIENEEIAGFMIYELLPKRLHLLTMAVAVRYRRKGIASDMIGKLQSKLVFQRRNRITTHVRESNLDAQIFFRDKGFKAINVIQNLYEDCDEDAYLFQYRHIEQDAAMRSESNEGNHG